MLLNRIIAKLRETRWRYKLKGNSTVRVKGEMAVHPSAAIRHSMIYIDTNSTLILHEGGGGWMELSCGTPMAPAWKSGHTASWKGAAMPLCWWPTMPSWLASGCGFVTADWWKWASIPMSMQAAKYARTRKFQSAAIANCPTT